jgi:putative peptidoglycan lipid II flippase
MALMWYAIGLPGHGVIEIVDRVFYAERDTATPVKVAAAAVALNIAASLVLMRTELSFGGLALANSLAALVEATVLTSLLHRRTGWVRGQAFLHFGWRIGLAALTMAVIAMLLQGALAGVIDGSRAIGQAVIFLVAGLLSALGYVAVCEALGISDARRVAGLLRSRG